METRKLRLNDEEIIVNAGSEKEKALLALGWQEETGEKPGKPKKAKLRANSSGNEQSADAQGEGGANAPDATSDVNADSGDADCNGAES